eukprot:TRINITY_DN2867_c0_g1_i2.p1 TRINITY_DN2867_c0_g1~~TRINITY_DN2867_c0_g1_i2.p1  ORF type:complete len:615 (+),score=131.39 TRINITY_DN2867_c0_g1_i2:75-1919(+)
MIVVDIGSQTLKVQQNAKRPVMIPCAAAQTDELMVGKDAVKELSTRHSNSIQHISASIQNRKLLKLTHPRGSTECSIELLLALLLDKATEGRSDSEDILLTIPSALTSMELQRIKTAAAAIGINKLTFLPCVLAIAHYYQVKVLKDPITTPQHCLVIDAGCRFTTAAVIKLQQGSCPELVGCKAIRMGGHDVDSLFQKAIEIPASADCHPVLIQNSIEKSKKELSSLSESSFVLKSFSSKVTKAQFTESIESYLKKVNEMVTSVCTSVKDDLVHFVVSGGTGRIPALRDIGVSGGDLNLNLPTHVVDYDFCSVQGAMQWANSFGSCEETVDLKEHDGLPFKYWTFDKQNNTVNRLFSTRTTDSIIGDLDVYQQLDDVTSPLTVPSPDMFHRISNSNTNRTTSIDPARDSTITDCFDDIVQVPSNSHMEGDHKLLCCGTPVSLSGMITAPKEEEIKDLKKELEAVYSTKKTLKLYRERRNLLEEAQLRYEDEKETNNTLLQIKDFPDMIQLSYLFLEQDDLRQIDDMETLTNIINEVLDTQNNDDLPALLKSQMGTLVKRYFEGLPTPPTPPTPSSPALPLDTTDAGEVTDVPQEPVGWIAYMKQSVRWLTSFIW